MFASELPRWLVLVSGFVFGATWGSFFNVAIYRWPRDMSVVTPGSHCPACKAPIPAWRNVPIFAYLLQRGRAACCGAPMTPRYAAVEVLSGALGLAIAELHVVRAADGTMLTDAAISWVLWFAFAGALVIAIFADAETKILPEEVTVGLAALGLATATLRPEYPLDEIVIGAGAGCLFVYVLLVWGWERITGEQGMGIGDPKLVLAIGAFLGWKGALFAIVGGSLQGVLAYAVARASGKRLGPSHELDYVPPPNDGTETEDEAKERAEYEARSAKLIPFGPFLALAAIEFLFFGNWIVEQYVERVLGGAY